MGYVPWITRRLYPELRLFRNRTERRVAWRKAYPGISLVPVGVVVLLMCCWLALIEYSQFLDWIGQYPPAVQIGALGAPMITTGAILIPIRRASIRKRLRRELIDIGIPVCVQCGYDIRCLPEPRCPECGTAFAKEKGDSRDPARGKLGTETRN